MTFTKTRLHWAKQVMRIEVKGEVREDVFFKKFGKKRKYRDRPITRWKLQIATD